MLRLAQELSQSEDIDLIGVAGRHRRPPVAGYEPTIPMTSLPLARPWLYESWRRLKWPLVESVRATQKGNIVQRHHVWSIR